MIDHVIKTILLPSLVCWSSRGSLVESLERPAGLLGLPAKYLPDGQNYPIQSINLGSGMSTALAFKTAA
ncbi:MAG: hypothetical protein ACLU9S_10910 [Oscillospiraceae bacterium]